MATETSAIGPTIIPRIFTPDVAGLVTFIKTVFRASGELRVGAPTELHIGNSTILISDGGGVREARGAFLYVYVDSVDAVHDRAVAAGAISVEAPGDAGYGERRATIEDRWDNVWQIASRST